MRELAATLTEPPAREYSGPTVRARGKQVLVQPLPDTLVTPAGLLLNTHNIQLEPIQRAKVLSVGDHVKGAIKPGDIVIYKRQWGRELDDKFCGQLFLEEDMIEGVRE
jgi:co-chaperonin GroES (HSP10)